MAPSSQLSSGFHKLVFDYAARLSALHSQFRVCAAGAPLVLVLVPTKHSGSQNNNYSPTNSFVRLEHLARRRSGPAVTQSLNQLGTEACWAGGWVGGGELQQEEASRAETAACGPGLVRGGVGRVWTTARAQQRPAWTQRLTAQTGLTLGGVSSPCTKHFWGLFTIGLSSLLPGGEM